jgi:hypothetical protein
MPGYLFRLETEGRRPCRAANAECRCPDLGRRRLYLLEHRTLRVVGRRDDEREPASVLITEEATAWASSDYGRGRGRLGDEIRRFLRRLVRPRIRVSRTIAPTMDVLASSRPLVRGGRRASHRWD